MKNYTLKPTYTPVMPRGCAEAGDEAAGQSAGAEAEAGAGAGAGAEAEAGAGAGAGAGIGAGTHPSAGAKAGARQSSERTATQLHANDCIRPENEDDDGYDPYSDRIEPTPLFEPDPWE